MTTTTRQWDQLSTGDHLLLSPKCIQHSKPSRGFGAERRDGIPNGKASSEFCIDMERHLHTTTTTTPFARNISHDFLCMSMVKRASARCLVFLFCFLLQDITTTTTASSVTGLSILYQTSSWLGPSGAGHLVCIYSRAGRP